MLKEFWDEAPACCNVPAYYVEGMLKVTSAGRLMGGLMVGTDIPDGLI